MLSQRAVLNIHKSLQTVLRLKECQSRLMTTHVKTKRSLLSNTTFRYAVVGLGFTGVAVATYVTETNKSKVNTYAVANTNDSSLNYYTLNEQPPYYSPARSIHTATDKTGLKITLYQYQTCPFCCKVRTFLDYFGFSYDVIEVNSVTRKQTKWTEYRKVPFLVVELGEGKDVYQLKDSSVIISALYSLLVNKELTFKEAVQSYPKTDYIDENGKSKSDIVNKYFLMYGHIKHDRSKDELANERKWRQWVDDKFVHTLSPNIYRTPTEAYQAFSWFSQTGEWERHFSTWERMLVIYVGSAAMYLIGKNLKKRHCLKDDVRQSLYDEANYWMKGISKGKEYMGGNEPDLTDLNVYGILTAIEGCESFGDLLENTKIKNWFYKMKDKVQNNSGSELLASRGIVV